MRKIPGVRRLFRFLGIPEDGEEHAVIRFNTRGGKTRRAPVRFSSHLPNEPGVRFSISRDGVVSVFLSPNLAGDQIIVHVEREGLDGRHTPIFLRERHPLQLVPNDVIVVKKPNEASPTGWVRLEYVVEVGDMSPWQQLMRWARRENVSHVTQPRNHPALATAPDTRSRLFAPALQKQAPQPTNRTKILDRTVGSNDPRVHKALPPPQPAIAMRATPATSVAPKAAQRHFELPALEPSAPVASPTTEGLNFQACW